MAAWNLASGRQPRERIDVMMERLSMPIPECGCYAWLGKLDAKGYAYVSYRIGPQRRLTRKAATVAWELENAKERPDGLVVDHLCRTPWCVNPDHLEPVTQKENWDRGAGPDAIRRQRQPVCKHCGQLKERTDWANGKWSCRACNAARAKEWRERTGFDQGAYRDANKDRINELRRIRRHKPKGDRS